MLTENSFRKNLLFNSLLFITLLAAIFLRTYKLQEYPAPINQDELSYAYDGYCIAETGADRWGEKIPFVCKGFGRDDYNPPLYAYLSSIPIKLFGFSVYTIRLVSVLCGIASLLLLFLFVEKFSNQYVAFVAVLFAALSPWHIIYSRTGHQGTMLPAFFTILILFLWQRMQEKNYSLKSLILPGLAIGLSTNAYMACRVTAFLYAIVIFIEISEQSISKKKSFKNYASQIGVFALFTALGAFPQIWTYLFDHTHFSNRANSVLLPLFPLNKFFWGVVVNIQNSLNVNFLFFNIFEPNALSTARELPVTFPFFYLGLFVIFIYTKYFNKQLLRFMRIAFIVSLIPAVIGDYTPHSLRVSSLCVIIPIISAIGLFQIYYWFRNILRPVASILFLIIVVICTINVTLIAKEFTKNPGINDVDRTHSMYLVSKQLKKYNDHFDKIIIRPFGNQLQLYLVAFASKDMTAYSSMQKEYIDPDVPFYAYHRLDKYYFSYTDSITDHKTLLIAYTPEILKETNTKNYEKIDSVEFIDRTYYFYVLKNK